MTQPNKPGPSWETEAAEKDFFERRGFHPDEFTWKDAQYGLELRTFIAGIKCAQEKAAAPGEESWEKIRSLEVNRIYLDQCTGEPRMLPAAVGYFEQMLIRLGFDAALELVAKPLLKERDEARAECMEQARLLGMGAERELKLKATEAALREDLNKAGAVIECKDREISRLRQERYTLRQQLADLKEEHEKYMERSCKNAVEMSQAIGTLQDHLFEATELLEWWSSDDAYNYNQDIKTKELLAKLKCASPSDSVGDAGEERGMSLHDLIQLSQKCEELEKQLEEALEVIRWYAMDSIDHHNYHATMGTKLTTKAREFLERVWHASETPNS